MSSQLPPGKGTRNLALIVGAFCVILAFTRLPSDPSYKGVSLTDWLRAYRASSPNTFNADEWLPGLPNVNRSPPLEGKAAADAVRATQAKSLPSLIKWISFRPTPWKISLSKQAPKLQVVLRTNALGRWLCPDAGYERLDLALSGFVILGSNAAPAIPALAKVAADPTAPGSRHAIRALFELGPTAIPVLTNLLTSAHPAAVKDGIRQGLGSVRVGAQPAIAALLRDLTNPDMMVAGRSAAMLGKLGQQPEIVVPALIAALDDPRFFVRQCAAAALRKFGPAALPAVPKLKSLLGTEYLVDDAARRTLLEIAPEQLTEAPEWKQPGRAFP